MECGQDMGFRPVPSPDAQIAHFGLDEEKGTYIFYLQCDCGYRFSSTITDVWPLLPSRWSILFCAIWPHDNRRIAGTRKVQERMVGSVAAKGTEAGSSTPRDETRSRS